MKRGASDFFNAARWIAALLVVMYHARGIIFPPLPASAGPFSKLFFLSTAFGHEAVIVFFVLSGLLVGGLSIPKIESGRFSLRDYALHRACRIYVVFVPALLLTAALDLSALYFYGDSVLITRSPPRIDPDSFTLANFTANLMMLYGIGADRFGSNGAVWSLVNEWWYYCLFGAIAAVWAGRGMVSRIAGVVACAAMLFFLSAPLLALGLVWALGVGAFLVARAGKWTPPVWVALASFLVTTVVAHFSQHGQQPDPFTFHLKAFVYDMAVGLAFSIVCASALARLDRPLPGSRLHRSLADFSFSLYLIHIPVIIITIAAAQSIGAIGAKPSVNANSLALWGSCCALSVAMAVVLYLAAEKHTNAIRRALSTALRVPDYKVVRTDDTAAT